MGAGLRIAADVGGTFTDVACVSADGSLFTCKIPSTPGDYAQAILEGIRILLEQLPAAPADVSEVLHASTVATNAILEGKGARTALVTTLGFRDILELRRIRVPRLYEPLYEKPPPLVPRRLRHEVRERLDGRGAIIVPLDEAQVTALAADLRREEVEAVAVTLLHAYINPIHEQRIAELLRSALPDCYLCTSSDILPEIREYERTSTTVINAYIGPVISRYLTSLRERLDRSGVRARLLMMHSGGGTMDVRQVLARPATVVESGPAAGVVGAARLGARAGYHNLITFDMGGTTAKASLVDGGRIMATDEYEVAGGISLSSQLAKGGGYALRFPVIDVSEVGAGGGSIVRVDSAGALKVGPDSAGAVPGPACYGRGGTLATVTDASVVLGYLNAHALAGGAVPIDRSRSQAALQVIAQALGIDVLEAAHGIHRLANSTMMRAVKAVSTYRGRDPRGFTLFAFGGNGGIHAAALAQELQITRIVVPPAAGVFSALGLLCADREASRSAAYLEPLEAASLTAAAERCRILERAALEELGADADRAPDARRQIRWRAELRYVGQGFELGVDLPREPSAACDVEDLRQRFEAEYARTYGHALSGRRIDFIALRVTATLAPAHSQPAGTSRKAHARNPMPDTRLAYFGSDHGLIETPVIARGELGAAARAGPLIIEEYEGTTVVPPGARAVRDSFDNIVITLGHGDRP